MANPKIVIEVTRNIVSNLEQVKIDHADVPAGWVGVSQILMEALKASTIKAFEQLVQMGQEQQPKIELANRMPPMIRDRSIR